MAGKLVAFDDDTLHRLQELGRNCMATFKSLQTAFADLLKRYNVPSA